MFFCVRSSGGGCRLIPARVKLDQVDGREGDFDLSYFGEADLSQSDFRQVRYNSAKFTKARVLDAAFIDCDCSSCDMSHADFSGSDFSRTNLLLACLHGVMDEKTRFTGASKTFLRGPDAGMAAAEDFKAPA
ncbi:MAG: hypothetical protein AUJ49_10430 [Desulfovibrionaceae bacterium CG1_02_65_16]|nr:MAG: hypothetical protein AUJ49_10430 [Desulfovibrionaceae bacterium CG1_02_65_16]